MKKPSRELVEAFFKWFHADPHSENEDYYVGTITAENLKKMQRAEFIDFFSQFAKEGGKVQTGGERTSSMLKDTMEKKYDKFRSFVLEPFSENFQVTEWLENIEKFKGFGAGIATIYLHRVDKKRFAIVNEKAKEAVRLFAVQVPSNVPKAYKAIRKTWEQFIQWYPEFDNFYRTDALSHFLIAVDPTWKDKINNNVYEFPCLKSFFELFAETLNLPISNIAQWFSDHDWNEFGHREESLEELQDVLKKRPVDVDTLSKIIQKGYLVGGFAGTHAKVKNFFEQQDAGEIVESLIAPKNGKPTPAQIDKFIETATATAFRTPEGKPAKSEAALLASVLLAAAYPDNFVDFRQGRWNWASDVFDLPGYPTKGTYGEKITWAGQTAKKISKSSFFQRLFSDWEMEPLWIIGALVYLSNKDEQLKECAEKIQKRFNGETKFDFAYPFDNLFFSLKEVKEAFGLLRRGMELLGLGPDDEEDRRISCTLQERGRKCILRVNYCSWAVMAVIRDSNDKLLFEFACRDDLVPEENLRELQEGFAATIEDHVYHLAHIPFETVENYQSAFELSLQAIKKHFARHKATPWRQFHRPELFHAFFDKQARRNLLEKGVPVKPILDMSVPELEENGFAFDIARDAGGLYFPEKIRAAVNSQINAALKTGKHIILIGPPGTGKSKLAKQICLKYLGDRPDKFIFTTATSDWTTYDTIGGLAPDSKVGGEQLAFKQGVFLDCFKNEDSLTPTNRWLIIDEINRADIDKAFGALFSVLAGDRITLPYKIEMERIRVRPQGEDEDFDTISPHEYVMPKDWRIVATMNTFDKTSLYEMSYAFMRRFAFIPVGVPDIPEDGEELKALITEYCSVWKREVFYPYAKEIGTLWRRINDIRTIGPAIIKDMLEYQRSSGDNDWTSALIMYVFPQFEGLTVDKQVEFVKNVDIARLCGDSHDEIIEHAADFFGIEKERFEEKASEKT